ncbi:MAG: peptidylprolyl isomerase [Candidatus Omnitrophota bacterium]|nr:peptidyl-prolyl cis-trans isomerase [Candidatus Omnitrophota bacterium]MBU1929569.1 peptidyl-prolyl cis-trans isomerase [Candidatus Omnitrophota bacterium]MBU2034156.1 peptidyl-prolyl cis-trans isomerase [Candidatus Omnitrophota bacterium]MBU2222216.1 peptidyl-prolyl cis-trans isomerase [Candidatus Omnitrophota bacterium]MBU2258700.1 peptidyl-prolyl cis-trans isomerase [Candidatus Omnitrophota bacterium]
MKKQFILFLAFFFVSAVLIGCDKLNFSQPKTKKVVKEAGVVSPPVRGTAIARVNNAPIILEDLNKEIEAYNAMVPLDKPEAKITTRDQKIDYLKNEMVRRMLLYQDALAKGLDRKEEVLQVLEKTKQDLLVMELVRKEAENVEVNSKEIEDYYNSYKDQLKEPEERQVREIVVSSEQEAKDILIQLLQGTDFATLAKDRSKSASAKDRGDLGFIKKGQKSAQFDAVAFSDTLEVGKISSIFKSPDGYCILKFESRRGGKQKSLTEMWDDIKRGLTFLKQQKKIEELIGNLSRSAKLEFYEGEIK